MTSRKRISTSHKVEGIEKTTPRDLFNELSAGMTALAEARQGKRTLPMHSIEPPTPSNDRD